MTTPVRWLDEREQSAWRSYLEMYGRLMGQLGREMQEQSGLSHADFAVLVRLSEHDADRMRILELARSLNWEKSRLSHQLTRMQQRGLVERKYCEADRRGAYIALTAAGREAVESAAPLHVESVRRYLFDEITPEQVAALDALARTVIDRLDAECTGRAGTCGTDDDPCS